MDNCRAILVTGATGLLGRHVIKSLHGNHKLHALVRHIPDKKLPEVTYHKIDLAEDWSTDLLPSKVDAIIHLAQSAKFRDFPDSAIDVFKVNIESTARLLDYAIRVNSRKFIFASSGGVYGNGANAFKENSPIAPPGKLGHYLGSKLCGETLAQSYVPLLQIVIFRPFFIFGPDQNRSMLIPRLMDNIVHGRPISLQGESGIRINPIHVQDAATAVSTALRIEHSSTFNIAGPDVLSIREICESIGSHHGREPLFKQQAGEPQDLIGNNAAMCEELVSPEKRLLECLPEVA